MPRPFRYRRWRRLARATPDWFVEVRRGLWMPRIAGGGGGGRRGGGSVTTVVNVPAPTEEERALQRKQVELLDLQVQEARRQSKLLEESFPQSGALLQEQLSLTRELASFQRRALEREERLAPISEEFTRKQLELAGVQTETQKLLLEEQRQAFGAEREFRATTAEQQKKALELQEISTERALKILRGEAEPLSPQQEAQIEQTFTSAEQEAKTSLRQFGEELAASRGLRLTDAPIGAEVLRETGRLSGTLAGAKAKAKLDIGQAQGIFTENVRQFQEQLRQQAFQNRLALLGRESGTLPLAAGLAGTSGLNLAVGGAPGLLLNAPREISAPAATAGNILDRMQAARFGQASTTRTASGFRGGFDLGGIGGILGGVGALASGFGAMKPFFPSTARLKTAIEPLDRDEYERARREVARTPVVRYRYTWDSPDDPKRLGILIETSPNEVSRDRLTLDVPGYLGLTLAAVKGVDRRVDRLERGLNLRAA